MHVFGFGSHFYFWFYQIRWTELRRGYNPRCLVAFGLPELGGIIPVGA